MDVVYIWNESTGVVVSQYLFIGAPILRRPVGTEDSEDTSSDQDITYHCHFTIFTTYDRKYFLNQFCNTTFDQMNT